jgi:hypothetical protein
VQGGGGRTASEIIREFITRYYAPTITKRPVAIAIIVMAVLLMVLCGVTAATNLKTGVPFADNFPDNSYLTEHYELVEALFGGLPVQSSIVVHGVRFDDPAVQERMELLVQDMEEDPVVSKPVKTWLRVFHLWRNSTSFEATAAAASNVAAANAAAGGASVSDIITVSADAATAATTGWATAAQRALPFEQALQQFLLVPAFSHGVRNSSASAAGGHSSSADGHQQLEVVYQLYQPAQFRPDCVFTSTAGADGAGSADGNGGVKEILSAVRMSARIDAPTTLKGRIRTMDYLREKFSAHDLPGFIYAYYFLFSDRDKVVYELLFATIFSAAAAILVVLVFFVEARTVIGIFFCIVFIDLLLFCEMAIWDIPVDISSFICLVIAIGLSVDYVVHVGYAFEKAVGDAPTRAASALAEIGVSVFKGGASTFLGVVMLAQAEAAIFRMFFKMLFGIVLFGMLAGMLVFPALMSLIGQSKARLGPKQGPGTPRA